MSAIFKPLTDVIAYGFIGLWAIIDGIVYKFVAYCFKLFWKLAQVELLDNAVYRAIADKVYLFIGIVALFALSVALLKALVNPDDLSKGVIKSFKSLITSVILVILTPTIFNYAFSLQAAILEDDIIGKIFQIDIKKYREENTSSTNTSSTEKKSMSEMCDITSDDVIEIEGIADSNKNMLDIEKSLTKTECQGNYITMTIFEAFFYPTSGDVTADNGTLFSDARKYMIYTGDFSYITQFVKQAYDDVETNSITYSFIISTVCGCFLVYLLLSFSLDLGVRFAKLAFYQLIAPIPILLKMIPGKEGQFDKWLKVTISTFLEVFIRLFIIDFVIFMCSNIFEIIDSLEGFQDVNLIGKAILALGLFAFAKQAPKLLKDAIGIQGGNLKVGIKGKLKDGGALAASAGIGAAATTATRNFVHGTQNVKDAQGGWNKLKAIGSTISSTGAGAVSGLARGAYGARNAGTYTDVKKESSKAASDAVNKRTEREAYRASHGDSMLGVMKGHIIDNVRDVKQWAGIEVSTEGIKKELDVLTEAAGYKKKLEDLALNKSTKAKLYNQQIDALNQSVIKREDYATDAEYSMALNQRATQIDQLKRAKNFEVMRVVNENLSKINANGQVNDAEFREIVNSFQTFKAKNASIEAVRNLEDLTARGFDPAFNDRDAMTISKAEFDGLKSTVTYTKNHKTADNAKQDAASRYAERIQKEQSK